MSSNPPVDVPVPRDSRRFTLVVRMVMTSMSFENSDASVLVARASVRPLVELRVWSRLSSCALSSVKNLSKSFFQLGSPAFWPMKPATKVGSCVCKALMVVFTLTGSECL